MSPYVSPRQVSERRSRSLRTAVGIAVEGTYALALLGLGFILCTLASML
jgi:hypothetical protein